MIADYRRELYEPAHRSYQAMARDGFAPAREYVRWNQEVTEQWAAVQFVDAAIGEGTATLAGSPLPVRALVDLAGLFPRTFTWRRVVGRIGAQGELEETEVLLLEPLQQRGTVFLFGRDFTPRATGRLGFAVRVSSNHYTTP